MVVNERLERFLELQNKNISFEDIAKDIGISPKTLRSFLNKSGYKSEKGKYVLKEEISTHKNKKNSEIKQMNFTDIDSDKKVNIKKVKPKKDRKINVTQEDIDKLCEVYDWYLEVKDYKSMKPKKTFSKDDVNIEETNITDLKSTNIRVDKQIWEDFQRLCSNSKFSKQEIITQALRNFIKEYKHLI